MVQGRVHIYFGLIDAACIASVARRYGLVVGVLTGTSTARMVAELAVAWRLVSTRVRPLLVLGVVLELGNNLHRVGLLGLGWIHLSIHFAKFLSEEIPLGWSHVRVVSLELHLVDRSDIALGRVETCSILLHGDLLV